MKSKVVCSFHTDKGIRDENQDSLLIMEDVLLFAVADGMGGGCYGSRVGQMALRALEDEFTGGNVDSLEYCYYLLLKKIQQINKYVCDLSSEKGCTMGTTLSVLLFNDDRVLIGNVGDTYVCRIRNHQFKILSKIHSIAGEQYENGLIGYEEYKKHDMKHVLTQAIGTNDEITPYLVIEKIKKGDTYIICSDGVYNFIDEAEICKLISDAKDNLKEACVKIINAASEYGSNDNMTVVIIRIV